jgi:hypothetical protein
MSKDTVLGNVTPWTWVEEIGLGSDSHSVLRVGGLVMLDIVVFCNHF